MQDSRIESHSDVLLAVYVARVASDDVFCCKQKQKLKTKTAIDSEKQLLTGNTEFHCTRILYILSAVSRLLVARQEYVTICPLRG